VSVLLAHQKDEFHRFETNMKWFQDNYKKLKKEYAGEYVAVDCGKVLMHNKNARTLIEALKEKYKDVRPMVVEYISRQRMELIL
jgi:uncharacterized protein involved in tellurium resistance